MESRLPGSRRGSYEQGSEGIREVLPQDRDMSAAERKMADANLRWDHQHCHELAENILDIFFVFAPNPLRTVYISKAYEEVWGRSRQELYDRPDIWLDWVYAEDMERTTRFYAKAMQGIRCELEYRVVCQDDSVRWLHARCYPVRNEEGKFVRMVGIAGDVTAHKEKEVAFEETRRELKGALDESHGRAEETARLSELLDVLQSCQTTEEAYRIMAIALPGALSAAAGSLCVISSSRNVVEAVAIWGDRSLTEQAFGPDDCWALRRGRVHRATDTKSSLRCAHVKAPPENGYLCVPLAAQGETLGILYLQYPPENAQSGAVRREDVKSALDRQASAVSDRISLALANLRLREVLRGQSLRDPLTGLYNRRYMEDSLEREVRRAARSNQQVALLMIDIDHFKQFNDTFGHQAGDTVLRALGGFLIQRTRTEDAPCRYGGEEFALILPDTSGETARRRAELLREELKMLAVQHAGQVLGSVTVSIGIATYPEEGTAEELLKTADLALYRAKAAGRNRVMVG